MEKPDATGGIVCYFSLLIVLRILHLQLVPDKTWVTKGQFASWITADKKMPVAASAYAGISIPLSRIFAIL